MHLVWKVTLLIPKIGNRKLSTTNNRFQCQAKLRSIKASKTKAPFKIEVFLVFPQHWQDGSQNTHNGKSNSLCSPSL